MTRHNVFTELLNRRKGEVGMNTANEILKAKRVKVIKVQQGEYLNVGDICDVTKAGKEIHFRTVDGQGATYIKNYMLKFAEFEAA